MITYFVNFTLCSALLLAVYHLLLKNKAIYHFNRFYLVFSLLFSLTVPLITIKHAALLPGITPVTQNLQLSPQDRILKTDRIADFSPHRAIVTGTNYAKPLILAIYTIITLILLLRFAANLNKIRLMAARHKRVPYGTATLILIDERLTPHTFFRLIFLNESDFYNNRIEPDILKHELTHAQQYHSVDVIWIELVRVFCWFNPFLILYRNAIQLNHEFTADAAVVNSHPNIPAYQQLIVSKLSQLTSIPITSQFNYSVTKKRLIMITKTTSATAALLSRLAVIPVMAAAFMLFCVNARGSQSLPENGLTAKRSQRTDTAKTAIKPIAGGYPATAAGASEELMKEYADIVYNYTKQEGTHTRRMISKKDNNRLQDIYKQMNRRQQQAQVIQFVYVKDQVLPKVKPTSGQLRQWTDGATYGIWLNGKHVNNNELENYKPADFNHVFVSKLTNFAVNHTRYKYQVDLMTNAYCASYNKEAVQSVPYAVIRYRPAKTAQSR